MAFELRPNITEKTLNLVEEKNIYTFVIESTKEKVIKPKIRKYVEEKYAVKVLNVNTCIRSGKDKSYGMKRTPYRTKDKKIAYVKVRDEDSIPEFNIEDNKN